MAGEGAGIAAHPDAALVDLFRNIRQDARSQPREAELARPFVIDIGFDGAGLLPAIGQCQVLPLGMIKGRITNAVIAANGVGSATIDLRHGTFNDVPSLAAIYGNVGANIPTLTNAATTILDISPWTLNLQPNDVLIATLASASGTFTCVTLSIYVRHLKWPAGTTGLTDSSGNTLTTAGGNTVTLRS